MDLNTLQQEAYDIVLSSNFNIIAILGAAGTGKSYTTSKIVQDYPGSVALTATTNRAKEVISNMSLTQAYTTHSFMGFNMLRKGKSQYLAAVRPPKTADLVIVEEVSMLPLTVWNTLHAELLAGNIKKILLLGDPIQLPAVGIGINLNTIKAKTITLTEQMRQDSTDIALSEYLASFRKAIENKDYKFNPLANLPACISVTDSHSEFASRYNSVTVQKKILAYSNTVVDKYNQYINGEAFQIGDEVLIDKPLGTCKNGDTVLITHVDEHELYYKLEVLAKGVPFTVYHFKTKSGLAKFLEDADSDEEYWLRFDSCFNLKHQYACTVHKAQGSSYDTVFIDLSDILAQLNKRPSVHNHYARPIAYSTYLRLLYVAISRMRHNAVLYNGTTRNYPKFKRK
jgi:ATP-dependent exoDNAse (exonuclease V) alpha subunit